MKKKDEEILKLKSKNNDKCNKLVEKVDDRLRWCIRWLLEDVEGPRRVGRADDIKRRVRNVACEIYELRCKLAGTKYGRMEWWGTCGRKQRLYTPLRVESILQ